MSSEDRALNIISINANSIVSHERRADLQNFAKHHKPDLLLINETKLNSRHNVQINGYKIVRTDRQNAIRGGGTAILIKNGLYYETVQISSIQNFQCIETTIISLNLRNNKKVYIISAYAAAGSNSTFYQEIQQLFVNLNLQDTDAYYIIAGDLNSKHPNWGDTSANTRGNCLSAFINEYQIDYRIEMYGPASPSYVPGNSFLDLCLADARLVINTREPNKLELLDYDSDHKAIKIRDKFKYRKHINP